MVIVNVVVVLIKEGLKPLPLEWDLCVFIDGNNFARVLSSN